MKYPNPLQHNDTIGVVALSSGVLENQRTRFDLAKGHFITMGYQVLEASSLNGNSKHVSAPAEQRIKDFYALWNNPEIKAIIPPWGGEFLIELLPNIDFEQLSTTNPKWIMGYSDISTLLFPLTTISDIATLHGSNFVDNVPSQTDQLTKNAFESLKLKKGDAVQQKSSDTFQTSWCDIAANPAAPFNLGHKTKWQSLSGDKSIAMQGRIIGGCLDVLQCLIGTPFDKLADFKMRYRKEGVILYLENCELTPCAVARALLQMKFAGWLDNLNGLILGRSAAKEVTDKNLTNYYDALKLVLADLKFPVLYDADIGHVPPQMTIINGSFAELEYANHAAVLRQTLI